MRSDSLATPSESMTTPIKNKLKGSNKGALVRALAWEHPMVTLDLGTLSANAKRTEISSDPAHAIVVSLIQYAVGQASTVNRQSQGLLGLNLQPVFN
ncbi:hypothetical protein BGW38_004481 [Lunasporangiospora selenospora]|uniref:Uncharacterized protein n=1 Tax=Lunasporangiospora selenospora TaxID=979761 RepID=A0A9P6G0Q6_9FUNG|nr:hypothetical protein BGW38_004481 [Lunasporangiospora selenospora]